MQYTLVVLVMIENSEHPGHHLGGGLDPGEVAVGFTSCRLWSDPCQTQSVAAAWTRPCDA